MRSLIITTLFLSACASIVTGTKQSLSVETSPTNARCTLTNDKGTWDINSTPGTVTVHKALGDMSIKCQKGNVQGFSAVKSSIQPIEFGNIISGGAIGLAVDAYTGAGYDYPNVVMLPLQRIQ